MLYTWWKQYWKQRAEQREEERRALELLERHMKAVEDLLNEDMED